MFHRLYGDEWRVLFQDGFDRATRSTKANADDRGDQVGTGDDSSGRWHRIRNQALVTSKRMVLSDSLQRMLHADRIDHWRDDLGEHGGA